MSLKQHEHFLETAQEALQEKTLIEIVSPDLISMLGESDPFQDEEHNELLTEKLEAERMENLSRDLEDDEEDEDEEMTLGSMDRF